MNATFWTRRRPGAIRRLSNWWWDKIFSRRMRYLYRAQIDSMRDT